jgi:hypothetical protein
MVVNAGSSLAVEVKTPTKLGFRSHSMTPSKAATAIHKALKEALRQLAGGPGMLVVGRDVKGLLHARAMGMRQRRLIAG